MVLDVGISRAHAWPVTPVTVLRGLAPADPTQRRHAWEALVRVFGAPVHAYLRRAARLAPAQAKRLTVAFLAAAHDPVFLDGYDPRHGTFRAFLLAQLDAFARDPARRRSRRKTGAPPVRIDFDAAEAAFGPRGRAAAAEGEDEPGPRVFDGACDRSLRDLALARFRDAERKAGRARRLGVFERYECHDAAAGPRPTYVALAASLGIRPTDVTNDLHAARAAFRAALLGVVREVTATDAEYRAEAERMVRVLAVRG